MAFLPYSYDDGQPVPTEYHKASGNIVVGLGMALSGGVLAASAKPEYIALCDMASASEAVIPAMRITADTVFEAPLAAATSLKVGSYADVSATGLTIANTTSNKNIQIVGMDGTAAGSKCRVRFII